jgi:hypothetical protein
MIMSDFKKLKDKKRKTRLPVPPTLDLAGNNLDAPETTPAAPAAESVYGSSLRKTDRIVPFGTRVTEEFKKKFNQVAARDGLKKVELLEMALNAYEEKQKLEI